MYKPKMANSLQRIVILATLVSAIMLAGNCIKAEKQQDSPVSDSGVLELVTENPDVTVDALNQPVSGGLTSMITPMFWPFTYSTLEMMNFFLQIFAGQELPCTLWSLVPPRLACTLLQ